jgi:hypothetical protein
MLENIPLVIVPEKLYGISVLSKIFGSQSMTPFGPGAFLCGRAYGRKFNCFNWCNQV